MRGCWRAGGTHEQAAPHVLLLTARHCRNMPQSQCRPSHVLVHPVHPSIADRQVLTDYEALPRVFHNIDEAELRYCGETGQKQLAQTCKWAFLVFRRGPQGPGSAPRWLCKCASCASFCGGCTSVCLLLAWMCGRGLCGRGLHGKRRPASMWALTRDPWSAGAPPAAQRHVCD